MKDHTFRRVLLVLIISALALGLTGTQPATAAVVKLSGLLPDAADVDQFKISPTGNRVVFFVRSTNRQEEGLFSVPLTNAASNPVRLSPVLPVSCCPIFRGFEISPDGNTVVYVYNNTPSDPSLSGIFAVPIDGSAQPKRIVPFTIYARPERFQITADNRWVVYEFDPGNVTIAKGLYSVPLDGSTAPNRLSPAPVPNGSIAPGFAVSRDGTRVVFRGDLLTDEVIDLFSVPVTGPDSAAIRLNPTLPPGGDVGNTASNPPRDNVDYLISADSRRVVYMADQEANDAMEVYSVPITGPSDQSVRLSVGGVGQVGEFTVANPRFVISPDSAFVAYADRLSSLEAEPGTQELYSVAIAGPASASIRLTPDFAPGGRVFEFAFGAGNRVVYRAKTTDSGPENLYTVPVTGPNTSAIAFTTRGVPGFRLDPTGRLMYAFSGFFGLNPVLGWPVAGPATGVFTMTIPSVTWQTSQFTADGNTVVYRGQTSLNISGSSDALWAVPALGPGGRVVKLTGPMVVGASIDDSFATSPDGRYVVYIADREIDGKSELYLADIGGNFTFLAYVQR